MRSFRKERNSERTKTDRYEDYIRYTERIEKEHAGEVLDRLHAGN